MIKSVSIHVIGEKITRNNVTVNTLASEVTKKLNAVLAGLEGSTPKVTQSVDFGSNQALITVIYDENKDIKNLK